MYDPIEPYRTGRLPVTSPHVLSFEESGNPDGLPVVVLHGGPGAGRSPKSRRYFDPKQWRIVLFDQRGSGQSTPHAHLEGNTTWDLVDDLETLRKHLNIERWVVFGGSWGSTLALAYASRHSRQVLGMVLRGIFLGERREIDWILGIEGAARLHPSAYRRFLDPLTEEGKIDPLSGYWELLHHASPSIRYAAALSWSHWEAGLCTLLPDPEFTAELLDGDTAVALARLECHYFRNKIFFQEEGWLLKQAFALKEIPGIIVHGRYDLVCPYECADALQRAWPGSRLVTVEGAGHSSSDPGMGEALMVAVAEMGQRQGLARG
jgi:proline iminopeptidase